MGRMGTRWGLILPTSSALPPRHGHVASVLPAQAPSLDLSPAHPGAPLGVSTSSSLLPTSSTSAPGRKHVLKHVRASFFPDSPLVMSKHLMNRN